jgi:hypothetical protein
VLELFALGHVAHKDRQPVSVFVPHPETRHLHREFRSILAYAPARYRLVGGRQLRGTDKRPHQRLELSPKAFRNGGLDRFPQNLGPWPPVHLFRARIQFSDSALRVDFDESIEGIFEQSAHLALGIFLRGCRNVFDVACFRHKRSRIRSRAQTRSKGHGALRDR